MFSAEGKPWPQILWDAEEALGLARANRWDLLPGPALRWDFSLEKAGKMHRGPQISTEFPDFSVIFWWKNG